MSEVSNADIYGALMDIKEDIGGLKVSTELQLKAIENHAERLVRLEGSTQRQKGAMKVWGLIATVAASVAAAAIEVWRPHH